MADLNATISAGLEARYQKLAGALHDQAAPLTDEQFWTRPFAFGNSFGHLVLHVTGNLNYYIGAQIAQTGYVRDRPREFSEAARPPKEETLKKFDDAIEVVLQTIRTQSSGDWSKPYTGVASPARTRFEIALHCATHLHHHIGQMIYIGFEVKRTT